jgi:hypothetical protein
MEIGDHWCGGAPPVVMEEGRRDFVVRQVTKSCAGEKDNWCS